jgi:chromosomal replication initiation ATPase DnaA
LWGEVLLSLALKQMDDTGSETGEAVLSAAAGLQKLSPSERVPAICDAVIDIAAALFNVSGRELRHPGRSSLSVSRVRQIAMYVTHVALGLSMREVGQGFGRDRTTVLHACHQIEDMRDDQEFDGIVAMTERVMTAALGRAGQ